MGPAYMYEIPQFTTSGSTVRFQSDSPHTQLCPDCRLLCCLAQELGAVKAWVEEDLASKSDKQCGFWALPGAESSLSHTLVL